MGKTVGEIKGDLESAADLMGLKCDYGTEDGYTWVTLYGNGKEDESVSVAHPGNYEKLSRLIADATGHDFYAANVSRGSIEGALDCDLPRFGGEGNVQKRHSDDPDCEIEEYGERFRPGDPGERFQGIGGEAPRKPRP